MSVQCAICKKETQTYVIYYGSKCVGPFLPRIFVCEKCEETKQEQIEKAKEEMENRIKLYNERNYQNECNS